MPQLLPVTVCHEEQADLWVGLVALLLLNEEKILFVVLLISESNQLQTYSIETVFYYISVQFIDFNRCSN